MAFYMERAEPSQMAGQAPCKGCADRKPKCHAMCEKYKAWKAKVKECDEAKRKELAFNTYRQDKYSERERKTSKNSQRYKRLFK